jgi:hypothetical protein
MPKSITQAMFARALRSRSALRRWLEDNHDEISGVLATQDLPPWSDLAAVARDHGVLDARGKPPTRHGVRKAWVALVARKRGKVSLESILADPESPPDPEPPVADVREPERHPNPRGPLARLSGRTERGGTAGRRRGKRGKTPGGADISGGLTTASDELRQGRDKRVAGDAEAASQVIPERYAVLGAGLGESQEGIAAITPRVTASSCTDLATGDLAADVVLGAIGMERDFRPLQHHQQLGLVGVQPLQQSIQRDEASAAAEDAVEPRAQRPTAALGGIRPIDLEIGVKVPN